MMDTIIPYIKKCRYMNTLWMCLLKKKNTFSWSQNLTISFIKKKKFLQEVRDPYRYCVSCLSK